MEGVSVLTETAPGFYNGCCGCSAYCCRGSCNPAPSLSPFTEPGTQASKKVRITLCLPFHAQRHIPPLCSLSPLLQVPSPPPASAGVHALPGARGVSTCFSWVVQGLGSAQDHGSGGDSRSVYIGLMMTLGQGWVIII